MIDMATKGTEKQRYYEYC